jgi:DNA polymerase/3'-5' exonuclease PolX
VTEPLDQRRPLNQDVAAGLDDVAALLTDQRAKPFRVRAYRRAAAALRRLQQPVSTILDAEGIEGTRASAGRR